MFKLRARYRGGGSPSASTLAPRYSAPPSTRLRAYAVKVGVQVMVVPRQAVLERLMVRLMKVAPGR